MTLTDMSGSKTDAVQQTRLNPIPPGRFIAAKRKAPVDRGFQDFILIFSYKRLRSLWRRVVFAMAEWGNIGRRPSTRAKEGVLAPLSDASALVNTME